MFFAFFVICMFPFHSCCIYSDLLKVITYPVYVFICGERKGLLLILLKFLVCCFSFLCNGFFDASREWGVTLDNCFSCWGSWDSESAFCFLDVEILGRWCMFFFFLFLISLSVQRTIAGLIYSIIDVFYVGSFGNCLLLQRE